MTTDPYPGVHYFCVDVETSALRVWEGELLTIGVVVVDGKGNVVDNFYQRVQNDLHPSWYDESMPAISETQKWWREQNDLAKMEAWLDQSRARYPASIVSRRFHDFCVQYGEDWTERIFVASPDKFDWVWTDYLLSQAGMPDPFWYHGIDIWSMNHGVAAQKRTGKAKGKLNLSKRFESHKADVEHHALSDAFALAKDLCDFLEKQPIDLDQPSLDDYAGGDEEPLQPAGVPEEAENIGTSEGDDSVSDLLWEG
jgi:hypothetical protein